MKFLYSWLLLVNLSGVLSGCEATTKYVPPKFAVDTVVTGVVVTDSLLLRTANDIAVTDDYVLIAGYGADSWLHIYDRKTGKSLRSGIAMGKGPGEMQFTETLDILPENHVMMWNPDMRKRGIYRIDSLLASNNGWIVQEEILPIQDAYKIQYMNRAGNDRWLYTGLNGWGSHPIMRFKLCHGQQPVAAYNAYPEDSTSSDFWGVWRSATTYAKVTISPDGSKMAHGLLYGCILEIFDLSGDSIRPLAIQRFYKPDMIRDMGVRGTDDTYFGFTHLSATDHRIYGIYVGTKSSEAGTDPNSIVVFDWLGNPLARYRTDYCLIALAADPVADASGETQIYAVGVNPEDMEWKLIRFKIRS